MEVGEMCNKVEPQVELPWVLPTTPVKSLLQKPVLIYSPGEGNQPPHHANGAVACSEFTTVAIKNSMPNDGSLPGATVAKFASDSGKTCAETAYDIVPPGYGLPTFSELMHQAVKGTTLNSNATRPGSNGLKNPVIPYLMSQFNGDPVTNRANAALSRDHLSLESKTIQGSSRDPQDKNSMPHDGSLPEAIVASVASDNGNTCAQTAYNSVPPGFGLPIFSELMYQAVKGTTLNSNATQPDSNGLKNPFIPSLMSQFNGDRVTNLANAAHTHHHLPLESKTIQDSSRDPQGTLHIACWSDRTSQDSPFTPNSAVRSESRQVASMQINTEEKNPAGEEENVPAEKLDNNGTSLDTEHCNPVVEFGTVSTPFKENHLDKGSRLIIDLNKTPEETAELIKDLMAESAKGSHIKSLNFDLGARDESSAGRENATAHLGKDGVVVQETNVGLACDLTTSMQQASNNCMSLAEDTQAPRTTPSRKSPPEEKPKENPTAKKKYMRRKALNKSSAPPTEVTGSFLNFDVGASDENPVGRKNATVQLSKDISVVTHEPNVGLPCDLKSAMEWASNNDMPLPEEEQDPSKGSPLEAHPKEKPTGKRKYERKKRVNKYSTPPTEITKGLNELLMPGLNKMSRRKSLNFDVTAGEESSVGGENLNGCISKEKSVVAEKKHANLAYDQSTFYLSLPVETQASTTSPAKGNSLGTQPKEKTTAKRMYARRKRLKTSALTAEMTTELTEALMPESTKMSCRRSLNFDIGATNDCSVCSENLNVHISKENGVVVKETHMGLTCDQNTCMNQAPYKYKSLLEDTKAPSISTSKGNSSGRKLNANANFVENKLNRNDKAAGQDGHESSADILSKSVAKPNPNGFVSQTVGSERKQSGFPKRPVTRGMNPIGAHYNESHWGAVKLKWPQTQTYEEFVVHLRRLTMERIGSPTSKGNSSGRKLNGNANFVENKINRNDKAAAQDGHESSANILSKSVAELNLNGYVSQTVGSKRKHSGFPKHPDTRGMNSIGAHYNESHRGAVKLGCPQTQTYEEFVDLLRRQMMEIIGSPTPVWDCTSLTRRPLKCIDATVAETRPSLTRKKQNKKISVLSSSADSSTNEYEIQQHHNFRLGPLGKSLDIAHDVHCVDALAEQFRQLDMNTEARDRFT